MKIYQVIQKIYEGAFCCREYSIGFYDSLEKAKLKLQKLLEENLSHDDHISVEMGENGSFTVHERYCDPFCYLYLEIDVQ